MASGARTLSPVGSSTTDDRGIYRVYALAPGDYIVEVAGQRVAGWHSFVRPFLRARPGSEVRVVVEQGGARRTLRLPVRPFSD